jgi:FdhE protein
MRQGEVAPKGAWIGDPLGGVKSPDPLVLPDPTSRFARTADRLEALSAGHPMEAWLHFMAQLASSQHRATTAARPLAGPSAALVAAALAAGRPPLAAVRYRRDPAWLSGLAALLDDFVGAAMPAPARAVIAILRQSNPAALDALADRFLNGTADSADFGPTLYVVAALQIYFTQLAAALPASPLRLLPQRGLCPCCGWTPVAGVVTAAGSTPGARYLHCSLCATAWNHVRAMCITCGESRSIVLEGIEGDPGAVKAETCGECHTYAKMLYQAKDMQVDPCADDLATLGLDLLLADASWTRHAPNPMLLSL